MEVEVIDHYLYTKEHEWASIEGDIVTIGITEHAQISLGDITFIELPSVGDEIDQFEECASLESVKAASDIFASMSGIIVNINKELENDPGLMNKSCYDKGWIVKIQISSTEEKNNLMTPNEYQSFLISSG